HYPSHFTVPVLLYRATRPAVDANLTLRSNGFARMTPAHAGVGFPDRATLRAIGEAALSGQRVVRLHTAPVPAAVSTAAARRAHDRLRRMLSAPVLLQHGSQASGALLPTQLAPLLEAHQYKHQIVVSFDPAKVKQALEPLLS